MSSGSRAAHAISDCHSPVFPNRSRFSNTVHTNLGSIQTAGKQADKNILPICTHFALLESPMQLEIMHGEIMHSDVPFLATRHSGNVEKTAYSEVPRRRRPSAAAKCTPTTICSLYHYQTQLRLCAGFAGSRYLYGDVAASS